MTSLYYRNWAKVRDLILEELHRRAQREESDAARRAFKNILNAVGAHYRKITEETRFSALAFSVIAGLHAYIDQEMDRLTSEIFVIAKRLSRQAHVFSYATEIEVLARLKGISPRAETPDTIEKNELYFRIRNALFRFGNEIKNALNQAHVLGEDVDACLARISKRFPKPLRYKRPPRELKPITEASEFGTKKASATLDFLDQEEWQGIVDAYKKEFIPKHRGPEYVFDVELGEPEAEEWYGWEVEQEITNDFLNGVRDGTNEAAQEAGIDDLMWVAVLDDKTRPEHWAKHGLTSRQIEKKLEGEWADFEDQTIVPPGGFNCRCRAVPYDSSLPSEPAVDYEEIDAWINS
jgi:hypothetical protein